MNLSANTKQELKYKVKSDGLIWDEPIRTNKEFEIIYKKYPINIWKYIYNKNNEHHTISSSSKRKLKDNILSKGLKWKEHYIKEISYNFEIIHKPYPISIWEYVYNENKEKYVISADSKQRLKDKVLSKRLNWDESIIKEIKPNFEIIYRECLNIWSYIYIENNEKHIISSNTKQELKDNVINNGLTWDDHKITNIKFEILYMEHLNKWIYTYIENNEMHTFSSNDKQKLIEHVLSKGLKWGESDITIEKFEIEFTGRQGHEWEYKYIKNNKTHVISARKKHDLIDKILSKGFQWDESRIKGLDFPRSGGNFIDGLPSSSYIGAERWSRSHYKF